MTIIVDKKVTCTPKTGPKEMIGLDRSGGNTTIPVRIKAIRSRRVREGRQVLAVGGDNADCTPFLLPLQQAVQLQESGHFAFYVEQPQAERVWVKVIHTRRGVKYLRTSRNMREQDNLLTLPEWNDHI